MAREEEGKGQDEGEVVMVESGLEWGALKDSCGRNWGCGYETMWVDVGHKQWLWKCGGIKKKVEVGGGME